MIWEMVSSDNGEIYITGKNNEGGVEVKLVAKHFITGYQES